VVGVVVTEVEIGVPGDLGVSTDGAAGRVSVGWALVGSVEGTSPKFGIWRGGRVEAAAWAEGEDSVAEARRESTIQVAAAAVPALINMRVAKATARVRRCRVYRGRTPSGEDGDI
jgi:hypothetical protein